MKKSTVRHPSRLAPQRPVRKTRLIPRTRSQNSYRRNRVKGESRKIWLKGLAWIFGLLTLAGLCLGLVMVYHQLLTCSTFCIKDINNIEIEGAKRLSRGVVLQQANITPGISLLSIRPGRVERALAAHPWIAKAEVSRKWPHNLHVRIQERDPIALVQIGEELYYTDHQGNLFKPLSPGDPHNFPVITGLKPEQFQHPDGAVPEIVTQAFQLLEVLKKTPPPVNLENVSEVHADLERGFTLYANGLGVGLDLGFKDYSEKLQKFAQLWPVLVHKGLVAKVGRINLNYPRRALVTLKGMEENP
ncbi:MAG: FtsQ-type POTRA domain-containing protein [Syntrophobacterales bacterium]|jgi:cell division protein FtsQ|nr:FtsQ-type POTRA domain-containing protein [Syntrophobacterales bacterium]